MTLRQVKVENKRKVVMLCPSCGYQTEHTREKKVVQVSSEKLEAIRVLDSEITKLKTMPTTDVECPKCGNEKAYWWLVQTRSGDEPPTIFYRCTSCSYTWRQYS
jgi:DNA-directed RNA polymerase subunit M